MFGDGDGDGNEDGDEAGSCFTGACLGVTLKSTLLVVGAGAIFVFFFLGFLLHKTARAQPALERLYSWLSRICLVLAGLSLVFVGVELAFRAAVPGGYFTGEVRLAHEPDAIVEQLPDGSAFWEYRGVRDFDERGFRGEFKGPEKHSPRIVLLGDSVAFGASVERETAFPFLLEQGLEFQCPKVALYDLAVPAYSTLQERISLEKKGLAVKPDFVMLAALPNDIEQYTIIGKKAYDVRMKDAQGIPMFSVLPLPDVLNRMLLVNSVFYQWATLRGVQLADEFSGRRYAQMDATVAEFEKIRAISEQAGAKTLVVLFPMLHEPLDRPENENTATYHGKVKSWASDHQVPLLDLRPLLAKYPLDDIRIDKCCHLTPKGHAIVADILLRWLLEHLSPVPLASLPAACVGGS